MLASVKAHAKYLVRVLWAPGPSGEGQDNGERHLITASQDQSIGVYLWRPGAAAGAPAGEEGCSNDQGAAALSGSLTEVKQVPYLAPVQDVLLLTDGFTLVVALKASNYLRLLDLRRLKVSGIV